MRVRRSSDNAEQDFSAAVIADANGNRTLDTASLLTFCGAGNGFVTTWYDQSGNGRHAVQTTAANQPRIVNAGVVHVSGGRPATFYSGAQFLNCPTRLYVSANGQWTTSTVCSFASGVGNQLIMDADNSPSGGRLAQFTGGSDGLIRAIAFNSAGAAFTSLVSAQVIQLNVPLAATAVRDNVSVRAFLNYTPGALVATTGTPATLTRSISLGSRANNTTELLIGSISEAIIFPFFSESTRAGAVPNQISYYGII